MDVLPWKDITGGWGHVISNAGKAIKIFRMYASSHLLQVYLVEIADTDHRGMFGASGALSVSVGITLTFCLGVSQLLIISYIAHLNFFRPYFTGE